MITVLVSAVLAVAAAGAAPGPSRAAASPPLPLGRADLGHDSIVFSSSGDLWVVPRAGGEAAALTTGPAWDDLPLLSPDGTMLAFSRSFGGEKDLYVMPAPGGEPRRLTWHPKGDFPRDWSPDGRSILFSSSREGDGLDRLYVIAAAGGTEQALDLPRGSQATYSPDGTRLAMTERARYGGWLRYRGGSVPRIQVVDLPSGRIEPLPAATYADWQPMWVGEDIYFLSERDGTGNLYRWRPGASDVTTLSHLETFGFESASPGPGGFVLMAHGRLWLYEPADHGNDDGRLRSPDITLPESSRPNLAAQSQPVADDAQEFLLTPDGRQLLVTARGDVFAVECAGGRAQNLTDSPGVADRTPAMAPDGTRLAWFSDQSGEYRLLAARRTPDGRLILPAVTIAIGETPTFYSQPIWSPDSKHLVTSDVHRRLWLVDVDGGRAAEIDRSDYPGQDDFQAAWSPDGRHVAWVRHLPSRNRGVFVREVNSNAPPRLVTPPLASCESPVFAASGDRLYATTGALGPAADTFGMTGRFYQTMLSRSIVVVRLNGIADRPPAVLPTESRNFTALGRAAGGKLLAVTETPAGNPMGGRPNRAVHLIDPVDGVSTMLAENVSGWEFSTDGSSVLTLTRRGPAVSPSDSAAFVPVSLDSLVARVDRPAEWRQIFHESWRLMRDYFYDPGHHGQDLAALEREYATFLPALRSRQDLGDLIRTMFGHISVSHLGVDGGDDRPTDIPEGFEPPPPVGLIGADVATVGSRFRLTRIFIGDNRSPLTSGPLAQPGIDARVGEWLLTIGGRRIDTSRNLYAWFEMAGRGPLEMTIGPDSSGVGARTVSVRLLRGENTLRRLDWAESNRRFVAERSGGRLGYLHLPDTGMRGAETFHQLVFAQRDREGLVIDERFNSGGAPADLFIETLLRRPLSAYTFRDGHDVPFPSGVFTGPLVMITNESAGSGGDTLPWMFRRAGLGPLVGTRTMGAGIGGFIDIPALIDGGRLDIPTRGFYNPDGRWEIENGGVIPDIEVDITPIDWRAGRDPQLERAVEAALDALKASKPAGRRSPRGQLPPG